MNDSGPNETATEVAPHWTISVLHAAHLIEDRMEEALDKVGLSMAKHGALRELGAAGEPLTLSQLATRLSCVRSNMTQLVDRLEADGLVKRLDDPADRRSVRAELTEKGKTKRLAGDKALRKAQQDLAASLTRSEREALEEALAALK